jgi:large subunit ribosomal protein L29
MALSKPSGLILVVWSIDMKIKEIRQKETGHIHHELAEQQKHLYALRTQSVTEKLEDPSQLGKAKKTIARLRTILREREMKSGEMESGNTPVAAAAPVAESK